MKSRCRQGHAPSEDSSGVSFLASFYLPIVVSSPWCSLEFRCGNSTSSVITEPAFCGSVRVQFLSFYADASHWIRALSNRCNFILTSLHLQICYFRMRSHSQMPGIRACTYFLRWGGGHDSTYNRE